MKKTTTFILMSLLLLLVSCKQNEIDSYGFYNSGFEEGDLSGWTTEGNAFTDDFVSFRKYDDNGNEFNQKGRYFYYGGAKEGSFTGTLTSKEIKVKGNGIVSFYLGAGKNPELTYVSFYHKNKEIVRVHNNSFDGTDTMHQFTVNLSDYLNKKIVIKIVDEDIMEDGFNYINVDEFIFNYKGPLDKSVMVKRANKYIKDNIHNMNDRYRHTYHAMSQFNWGNDPNGLIWYNNEFHLFYQHNPYEPSWGPMHWGHQTSKDLIKWEHLDVAIAPDKTYDNEGGAFSGTAIEKDGRLYLYYTSVGEGLQQQSLAYSDDGITFHKHRDNPIVTVFDLPKNAETEHFRDPKVFYHDNYYYMIVSGTTNKLGQLFLYKSENLIDFEFVGEMLNNNQPNKPGYVKLTGGTFEVADYINIDGKEILISSPMRLNQDGNNYENLHSVVYMEGKLDYQTGKFSYETMNEIDSGFDFYAAQTAKLPDGRTIMIAWMQMWDRTMPTAVDKWAGRYTLPTELSYKNNRLYQTPIKEIENYRKNHINIKNQTLINDTPISFENINGKAIELEVEFDLGSANKVGLELFKGEENHTLIYYDKTKGEVVLDRTNSGRQIRGQERNESTRTADVEKNGNKIKFRIFLDVSSVEVFINDGYKTITSNVYPLSNDTNITFFSSGGNAKLINVDKYNIIVD